MPVTLPVAGIFIPFEQNSIQYGLFEISYKTLTTEQKLGANLSKIILTALKDDEIDDETILTFAFYLHAAVFKVSTNRSESTNEIRNHYIRSASPIGSAIDAEFLIDKFQGSKQELINIYQDVMVENQPDLPPWVEDWIAAINNEVGIKNEGSGEGSSLEKYIKIIATVNSQLGLSHDSLIMVSYFLQQTIEACQEMNA